MKIDRWENVSFSLLPATHLSFEKMWNFHRHYGLIKRTVYSIKWKQNIKIVNDRRQNFDKISSIKITLDVIMTFDEILVVFNWFFYSLKRIMMISWNIKLNIVITRIISFSSDYQQHVCTFCALCIHKSNWDKLLRTNRVLVFRNLCQFYFYYRIFCALLHRIIIEQSKI